MTPHLQQLQDTIRKAHEAGNKQEKYMIEQGLADLLHAYEDRKRAHKRRVARFN